MPTNPDSTTPPTEGEPLDADLPAWETTRRRLDPLDPETTTSTSTNPTTTPPANDPTLDELRNLVDELEDEPPAPLERPTLSNRVRSILVPRSEGDPRVAAVAGGLVATFAGIASLGLDATVGKRSGAWVMRPDESAAIGEPLGRIAARRVNVGDTDPTDLGDAIEASSAALMYGIRARSEHHALTTSTYRPGEYAETVEQPPPGEPADVAAANGLYFGEPPQ